MTDTSIVWLRQDLRLGDQPALVAAAAEGAVIPVYVLDDETPGARYRIGAAQRWWLHGSLERLARDFEAIGSRLVLRRGRADVVLARLLEETGAGRVHALHHAEPWWRETEVALGDRLELHDGNNLVALRNVVTAAGQQFRIYSAFWRALQAHMPPPAPLPVPAQLRGPARWPHSDSLADWALLPTKPNWAIGFDMVPGAAEAARRLEDFVDRVGGYEAGRNLPAEDATSRLSPHLHFGEISPATVWHRVYGQAASEKFRKELAWRDFTQGVTLALPSYAQANGNRKYDAFGWRTGEDAEADLRAWQRGRTGYPIVDAGMRQLWATGWMHNRVRMITASFLVKHLLIDWRRGWDWFWDTLVDADYGNNSVNWQWIAGTGVDANMFSRIMAPLVQSEKFGAGDYIRRWVPELADVADPWIHDPGPINSYPAQIIGHREGRERALAAARASGGN
ncbi:MAG TPA: deoxyribodipyrimidine photo-lyase [Sphingomicrobium sp.]